MMKKQLIATVLLVLISVSSWAEHPGGTVYADVNGLVCDFCARSLEKVFGNQEAVDGITVDLEQKVISIHFKHGERLDDDRITQLITDSGFHVREIRHEQ